MSQSTAQQLHPEFELLDWQSGAIRYLEHDYPESRVRWHYHANYELHYIEASAGKAFVGDFIGDFKPGYFYLIGPKLPHKWVIESRQECSRRRGKVVHFDHDTIAGIAHLAPEITELLPFLTHSRHGLLFPANNDQVAHRLEQLGDASGAARLGLFCQMMHELTVRDDYQLLSTAQIESRLNGKKLDQLNKVVDFLMASYREPVPIGRVADLVGMSESNFSRFFRKSTGRRFSDFVIGLRIGKACELLRNTDQQITTICYEVGFRNVANFNRRFQQRKGTSPSAYRRQAWSNQVPVDELSVRRRP